MGFISRKGISYNSLFYVICFLWLCGSDRVPSGFKIYRSERDIFTNLNCTAGEVCTESQCKMYGAECVNENNCDHCRCWEGRNTFLISNNDQGKCKRDEDIEPKSVPEEAFQLENTLYTKCLKSDNSSNNYILGTSCVASRSTLDMLWIWSTATGKKQLINVKTLKCMERQGNGQNVIMEQCDTTSKQELQCTTEHDNDMQIGWSGRRFLHMHISSWKSYAISKRIGMWRYPQQWSSEETSCETSTAYNGCYRFSDGSFMKYLDYDIPEHKLLISAPLFQDNNNDCKVSETFNFLQDGHTGVSVTDNIFSLRNRGTIIELKFTTTEKFKAWNGSLLNVSVVCGDEEHCVLLKLKSLPTYSDVINTTLPPFPSVTSTEEVITFPSETTTEYDDTSTPSSSRKPTTDEAATVIPTTSEYDKESTTPITTYSWSSEVVPRTSQSTKGDNEGETPSDVSPTSITSTTENPQEGFKEEASESGGGNSVAIAVTVTLLLVALALALGFLFYYRRRKRAQVPQNNNRDTGVVNYSKDIYEDPDRTYETLKENENGVPCNQPGITSDTYTYPDNIMLNPTPSEQEYSYAKNTDFPRSSVGTKPEAKRPINNGVVYETLEQPGKPRDDDFYNYPDNTSIAKPPSSELEYTYAKDTDFARCNPNTKVAASQDPANNAMYHTLEQPGQPADDDFYNYPDNTNIAKPPSSELEYTYAKDTDFPRCNPNTKLPASQDPEKNAVYETLEQPGQQADDDFYSYPENTNIAKPPSSELEYSYAKNTDIPTLDEQSPPQPPVYSTLEGPDDGDNKQVTEERPSSNDHAYIDVIHDSNN